MAAFLKSGARPGDEVVGHKLHNNVVLRKMAIHFEFKFYSICALRCVCELLHLNPQHGLLSIDTACLSESHVSVT